MKNGICHIVAAGPASGLALHLDEQDILIAADGGLSLCLDAGVRPDLYIGDSDSVDSSLLESISCERIDLPCDKDDTDTLAAVREGLARGYENFEIHAALGGDLAHTLANVQVLSFIRDAGAWGVLHGDDQHVYMVIPQDEKIALSTRPGSKVSVLSYYEIARGVCEHGLKWELDDADLTSRFPVGVSNVATASEATFSVGEGSLLVIMGCED